MAERIAILGGEPYAEWIERSGAPQHLFRTYCNRWPEGTTECVAIGDEFYVRANDGEMHRVYDDTDFEDETAWCAQCGTPLDTSSTYYVAKHTGATQSSARNARETPKATAAAHNTAATQCS